ENVGVVVFEVVEDRDARPVMHELRALVEERGVVLVGLHDEWCRRISLLLPEKAARETGRGRRPVQPCRHPEVSRHAADQESRPQTRGIEQMRQETAGGGLAVGAGDGQYLAAA